MRSGLHFKMMNFNDAITSRYSQVLTGVVPRNCSDGSCPPVGEGGWGWHGRQGVGSGGE